MVISHPPGPSVILGSKALSNRAIVEPHGTFGKDLVVLHIHTPSMFDEVPVHVWTSCGGFYEEHSILDH